MRGDETVQPRAKTFELLVYLVEHRDRVVSKDELREALWPQVAVTENSVMQCVAEARRVLGDDSKEPRFIRTVSKSGYQFIAVVNEDAPAEPRRNGGRPWVWMVAGAAVLAGLVLGASSVRRILQPAEPAWSEVGWWKFEDGAGNRVTDTVGGLSAEVPPEVARVEGIAGKALLFHSPEVVVGGEDSGRLPRGQAPRTLVAWMKAETTNGDSTVLFQQGNPEPYAGADVSDRFYLMLHQSGAAGFGSTNVVVGQKQLTDGKWHQVAGVFEGGVKGLMRLYVDGVEDASPVAVSHPLQESKASGWSMGRGMYTGTSFRGALDDVRVFARPLHGAKIRSLYRCRAGVVDLEVGGRGFYFAPVYGDMVETGPATLRNLGKDFAGAVLVKASTDCSLASTASADMGQDLTIGMDLQLGGADGLVREGGPFFRSRRASPGDGIIGGTSAGFWVHLDSKGQVRVMRLHPMATIAFSEPVSSFDAGAFHRLEARVRGDSLQVSLDGRVVSFDCSGAKRTDVPLASAWEQASPQGHNNGTAGIGFGCSQNRGSAGGQVARNIRVTLGR
ncbi:MAG: winged helix-turn-helix domain-containing protein [Acidobacteria bacterium]|nr:winged helix-turn-helix domain-containing protein [Acidobacteriota bacterium]